MKEVQSSLTGGGDGNAREPNDSIERTERRRRLLLGLFGSGMAGFSLVSLGAKANATPAASEGCGTYAEDGSLIQDLDCGVLLPNGEPTQDRDCGRAVISGELPKAGDNDCGVLGEDGGYTMTDNDCGKVAIVVEGQPWYHQDNDCSLTSNDLDCGKANGFGSTHNDNS